MFSKFFKNNFNLKYLTFWSYMIGVFCLLFYILFCFYLIQMQFIHSYGRGIICFDRTVALKFLNLFL